MKVVAEFERKIEWANTQHLVATVEVSKEDKGLLQSRAIFMRIQEDKDTARNVEQRVRIGANPEDRTDEYIRAYFRPEDSDQAIAFVEAVFDEIEQQYQAFLCRTDLEIPSDMFRDISDAPKGRWRCSCPACR